MKKSKKLTVVFGLAILISGVLAVQAGAFGPPHRKGGIINLRFLMELDLSDSQKAEVRNIINKYREEEKNIQDQLMEAKENSRDVIHAGTFDEEKVRQAFQQISPIMEDMMILRARFMAELRPLLNPGQLELLKKKRANHSERMKRGAQFRESMIDTWLQKKAE